MFTNLTNFRQLFSSLTGFVNPGDNLLLANNPQNDSAFFANFQAFLAEPELVESIAVDTPPVASVLPKAIGSASDFLKIFSTASSLAVGQGGQHEGLPAGDAKPLLGSPEIRLSNNQTATVPNRQSYSNVAPVNVRQLQIGVAENVIGSARPGKTRKLSAEEDDALPLQNTGLPPNGLLAFSQTNTGSPAVFASELPGQLPIDPPTITNGEISTPTQPVSANIVNGETSTSLPSISPNNQNVGTAVAPSNVANQQPSFGGVSSGTLLQNASVRHGQGAKQAAAISSKFGSAPLNPLPGVGAENQTGVTGQLTQTDVAASLPGVEWQAGVAGPAQSSQSGDAPLLPVNHILNDEGIIQLTQDVAGKNGTAPSGGSAPLPGNHAQKGISFTSGLFEPAPVAPEILAAASNIRRPVSRNSGQVADAISTAHITRVHVTHAAKSPELPKRATPEIHSVLRNAAKAHLNSAPRPEITPSFTHLAGNGVQPENPNSVPNLKQDMTPLSNTAIRPSLENIVETQTSAPPVASHVSRGDALYAANLRGLRDVRVTPGIVKIPQKYPDNLASRVSRPVEQNTVSHPAKAAVSPAAANLTPRLNNAEAAVASLARPHTDVAREQSQATISSDQRRAGQNFQHVEGKASAPIQTGLAESILPQGDILKPARTGERVAAYRPAKNATRVSSQKTGQILVNDANGNPQPTKIEFSTRPFEYIARDDSHSVSEPALGKPVDSAAPRGSAPAPANQTAAVAANDLPKQAPVSTLNQNGFERLPENVVRRNGSDVVPKSPRVFSENIVENASQKLPEQPENIVPETQNKVVSSRNQRADAMDGVAGRLFREPEIASTLENMISQNETKNGAVKRSFFPGRQAPISAKNSILRGVPAESHMQKPLLTPENNFPVSNEIAEDVLLPERLFARVETVEQRDALTRDVEKIMPEKLTQPRPAVSQTHQSNTRANFSQSAGSQNVPVTAQENTPAVSSGLVSPFSETVTAPVTVAEVPVFEIKKYNHNSSLAARQNVNNSDVIPDNFQSQMPNMLLQAAVNEAAPARPGFRPHPAREERHGVRPHAEISGETPPPEVLKTPVIDHGREVRVAPTLHAAKSLQIDTAVQDSGLQNHASLFNGAQTDAVPGENITGSSIHSFVQTGAKTPTITFQNATQFTTQLASMVQEQAYDIFRQPGAMPQQLFIQLEPKEMGIIRLHLSMKKNKLVGKIETGVAETSSLLHQNHSQLLSKLGDMGVQIHDFTISHNENLAGDQQQFAREQSAHQQANPGQYVEEGDVESLTGPVRKQVMQSDRIDVTV